MISVKQISGAAALGVAVVIGVGLAAPPAQAAYIVTLTQVGGGDVADGSASINLTGLSNNGNALPPAEIVPLAGFITTWPAAGVLADVYSGFTGPTGFGSGLGNDANSGSGDLVGINGNGGVLAVPSGYLSGDPLSDS
jgi:hypothetical protein